MNTGKIEQTLRTEIRTAIPERLEGEIDLEGEWEFYWKKLISPEEFKIRDTCEQENSPKEVCSSLATKSKVYSFLPKMWIEETEEIQTDTGVEKRNLPSVGYATYRLQILTEDKKNLALRIPFINTAYNLYIEGKLITWKGKVAKTENESISARGVQVIIIPDHNDKIDIVLQVSNFDNELPGVWASLNLGNSKNISNIRERKLFMESAITGILFIMGFYHLAIYSLRKNDKSPLWFGVFCLIICLRTLLTGEGILYELMPNLDYILAIKMDYTTMPLGILIFIQFIISLYREESKSLFNKIFLIVSVFFILLILFSKPKIFTSFLKEIQILILFTILYIEYIVIQAIRKKKEYSRIIFYGIILFIFTVINDILYLNSIINSSFYSSYGLVVLVFSQSYILSAKSSKAFSHVEELSQSLIQTNKDLQGTKDRATKAYLELEASQKKLVQSDKMITLGTMVAGIAHEINTPLGAIKANSENIQFSISQYLSIIQPDNNLFTKDELKIILEILELSGLNQKVLSTKEARSIRKSIITVLHKKDISLSDREIDIVIDLGFGEKLDVLEVIFRSPRYSVLLDTIQILNGLRLKAKVIETSAGNVSRIVRSLKSFMHFSEKDEMVLSDLIGGMESVLIILNSKLKMGIEVIKNYEEIPHIYCYIDELNQIWTNLIHNSIQAMNGEGKIIIEIQLMSSIPNHMKIDFRDSYYKGKYISISIEDNGPGIPPEIQTKIFEAFFTTKPMGEGSGLGLHIISKILEKHKGALNLLSEPGKTKFVIHIPSLEQDFSMK
jgi:signal transduction histidine kinase